MVGYIIAKFAGDIDDDGFRLNGAPALLLIGLTIAYFVAGRKYLGGMLWQRILKAY